MPKKNEWCFEVTYQLLVNVILNQTNYKKCLDNPEKTSNTGWSLRSSSFHNHQADETRSFINSTGPQKVHNDDQQRPVEASKTLQPYNVKKTSKKDHQKVNSSQNYFQSSAGVCKHELFLKSYSQLVSCRSISLIKRKI